MLKEEIDFLQRRDKNLFGKNFDFKEQTVEIFARELKKKQNLFWNTFSEGPSSSSEGMMVALDKLLGESRQKIFHGNYRRTAGRSGVQGKNK